MRAANLKRSLRLRGFGVAMLFALGFTAVSCRLVWLQLVQHDYYQEEAIRMHYVGVPIPPKRGCIFDRSGNVLAQTVTMTDLRIDGKLAWEEPGIFQDLAPFLNTTPAELSQEVNPHNRFYLLKKNLSEEELDALRGLKARCLIFKERMARVYPNGYEGSHVLGFVNVKRLPSSIEGDDVEFEVGVEGVELAMDKFLRGIPGERRVVRDASRKEIAAYRQSDRPARDGMDVVLTMDQVIQNIVESEADRIVEEYDPDRVHVMVLKPSTGEVLAVTNRPTFDPNNRKTIQVDSLRNSSVMDMYEPGSTFKIVTLAAALNENLADLDMPIFCENGKFFYAGKWLRDSKPHGMLSLREVVAKSSNIGFAKLGLLLGKEKIYEYAKKFGFGQEPPVSAPGFHSTTSGMLHPVGSWTPLSLTRVPMGYEVAVTNLQMAMAYGAIANDGKLMEPRLVKAVLSNDGKKVTEYLPKPIRQVVQPEIARKLREALKSVVSEEGTARLATVKGFTVAGKTGTAQKLVNGVYDHRNYIASFIGFLPAERPEFLVSVVVDRPRGGSFYGGSVAGPAFSHIATQVAQQLNLTPSNMKMAYAGNGGGDL